MDCSQCCFQAVEMPTRGNLKVHSLETRLDSVPITRLGLAFSRIGKFKRWLNTHVWTLSHTVLVKISLKFCEGTREGWHTVSQPVSGGHTFGFHICCPQANGWPHTKHSTVYVVWFEPRSFGHRYTTTCLLTSVSSLARHRQTTSTCLWLSSGVYSLSAFPKAFFQRPLFVLLPPLRDHKQALEERLSLSSMLARSQSDMPPRSMKDSSHEVHLPLGSQPHIREKYLTHHNTVRYRQHRIAPPTPRSDWPVWPVLILKRLDTFFAIYFKCPITRSQITNTLPDWSTRIWNERKGNAPSTQIRARLPPDFRWLIQSLIRETTFRAACTQMVSQGQQSSSPPVDLILHFLSTGSQSPQRSHSVCLHDTQESWIIGLAQLWLDY